MSITQKSWTVSLAIAIVGIAVTLVAASKIQESTHRHARERFQTLAEVLDLEIHKRIQRYEVGLHNFEGLFLASKSVEFDEFRMMFSAIELQSSYHGALGIGFIEAVPNNPTALNAFREELIAQGAPDFEVHYPANADQDPNNDTRSERFIIRYIEPYANNKAALGLDIGSEPIRRAAAENSLTDRKPRITGRIQLVQSNRMEAGFLYMLPVFRLHSDTRPEDNDRLLGWVYMPIVAQQAVKHVEDRVDGELAFEIFEGATADPAKLICQSQVPAITDKELGLNSLRSIKLGGQEWLLKISPSEKYKFHSHTSEAFLTAFGLILSLGAAWIFKSLSTQASSAEEAARNMSMDLQRLALVAKRTTNAVVITDVHRKITWTNEAFTTLTGYTREEVEGKVPGTVLQCSETDPATIEEIRKALSAGRGYCGEIFNRSKSGRGYWVSIDIQPMHDEDGNHIGYLAIELDVTEMRDATRQLAQETQRTKLALDSGRLAIWEWDTASDKLVLDDRWEEIIGPYDYEAGRFNRYWEERIHPDDLPAYQAVLEAAVVQNVIEGEWRYQNNKNEYVWVMVRGHVVARSEENLPLKMTGTIMEITARKNVELALKTSESRAKAMFERSHEAIFVFNQQGFVDCNPKTLEIFGFGSKEELMRFHPAELSPPVQPNGMTVEVATREKVEQVAREGFARFDWLHRKKSGETFEADVSLALIENGESFLAMGIVRDVSQRKELERQLSQAQKLESIGQLAAGVAHEINTPMQCVFSNIEYLQDAFERVLTLTEAYRHLDREGWSEESKEFIDKAEQRSKFDRIKGNITDATAESGDAAKRVIEIVRAMKTMSHPGTTDKVFSDLNKLVEDASIISRNRWKYCAKLKTELEPSLQGIPLLPAQLSQVMLNLIVNAADAISEKIGDEPTQLGSIWLRTAPTADGVRIEVEDTGNGMPEHVRKRIFDPFFTTKEVGKGTGQGLAIAYDVIVNQHQGRIDVESTPGVGTKFIVWLPVLKPEVTESSVLTSS